MAPSNASRSSKIAMALELLADAQAAKAHAALPPEEKAAAHEAREAAKEAKREKKRAAENERRGRGRLAVRARTHNIYLPIPLSRPGPRPAARLKPAACRVRQNADRLNACSTALTSVRHCG
eukprot:1237972-Prymnesium_polylepis.1